MKYDYYNESSIVIRGIVQIMNHPFINHPFIINGPSSYWGYPQRTYGNSVNSWPHGCGPK